MPVLYDLRSQLTRIDEQIVRLLEERCELSWDARGDAASLRRDAAYETAFLERCLEEGAENGMDEVALAKLWKCIFDLCQKPIE